MSQNQPDDRVPVQILIDPDLRHVLRVLLAEHRMTWGDLISPHLKEFVQKHRREHQVDGNR